MSTEIVIETYSCEHCFKEERRDFRTPPTGWYAFQITFPCISVLNA